MFEVEMDYYQITFSFAVTGDSLALLNTEQGCVKYSCYFHRVELEALVSHDVSSIYFMP